MNVLLSSATLGGGLADLASPKSQTWVFAESEMKSVGGMGTADSARLP